MKRSKKNDFVAQLKNDFKNSSSIIVSHYAGLSVKETDAIRRSLRENGANFKVTKNRLTKLALANTEYECITDMFNGPTAITYSSDSIVPAKITAEYEKKYKSLKILGGFFEGKKIDREKVKFLASLPLLDEIRGKLIGVLLAPAQRIALIIKEPSGQLARLLNKRSQELEKTN